MRHAPIDPALFIAHRRQLLELLPKHCVAIVHAADVPPTNGDGTLKLQPAADLFWLTGIEQEESVLVLAPDAADPGQREMLFVREPTELLCTWEGAKLSKEQAQQISGIAKVRWVSDLPGVLHTLLCESEVVMLNSNEHERAKIDVEPRDLRLARQLMEKYPLHRYERLALRVLRSSIARATVGTTARDWKRAAQVEMSVELLALGLGVHDLAPINGPFEPGWVLTVEPGIYIPDEGMGVRLENDILITETGPVDLCGHVPIDPDEIEQIMA